MSKISNPTISRREVRDFVAYVLISLAFVIVIVVAALEGIPETRIMNWSGLVLTSAGVFGQFVLVSRHFWKKRTFWILLAASFTTHLLFCVWLFYLEGEVSGRQWLLISLVEVVILAGLRTLMFGPKPPSPK